MSAMIALTQGDPSGIGPEIALKAWRVLREHDEAPRFLLLADPDLMRRTAHSLELDAPIIETTPSGAASAFDKGLPVVPLRASATGAPGAPARADAATTIEAIERAVELVFSGAARAVTTNPIAKAPLYDAGFAYPGHTEFLGELARRKIGAATRAVMMIWSEQLAVVPVTIHIPLARAPLALTRELITETALIVNEDLRMRFGVAAPRLAISGLNPHAGEDGTMGREEVDVIAPAIVKLRALGVDARGPYPADTMFHAKARARYDAALCMTHDQALIPIKTIAFETAVNVTLGLPFVRTSPDHGVAFDIAGKGVADPSSLIEALKLAARLAPARPA
ncbi:MAG: 4-hydroxythreonine-4-phosphate dehydrogenase PdxA [Hyphomicrobiales bacterium]|nr:4-hydroxythreonine-4-phosphate dehydrogenase PdxA [Hyphomicrobiales bacterium]